MIEIIPAILTEDEKEYEQKLRSLEGLTTWVQVDIDDGKFVPNHTINFQEVGFYETPLKIEVHLMVETVEEYVENFLGIGIERIVIPVEATKNIKEVISLIKDSGIEVGLALNPETKIEKIETFVNSVDTILILGVQPGFQNQEFIREVLNKVSDLKTKYPFVKIEVDGGIKPELVKEIVQAGADILVVGSYIFAKNNPREALEILRGELNE